MGKQYWLKLGDKVTGPFTNSQIRQLAAQGEIRGEHKISLDRKQWFRATNVKSLNIVPAPVEPINSSTQQELDPIRQPHLAETLPHAGQTKTKECPFCGEEILAKARKCKHCGEFLDQTLSATRSRSRTDLGPEKILWEAHPSFLYYVPAFVLGGGLILAFGLGIIIIIVAILDQKYRIFTVTNHKAMVKWGIISRHTKEVAICDIRNINMSQGVVGRIFGIGSVASASAGTGTVDVTFSGIKNPKTIRDLVRKIKEDSDSHHRE